jgi:hypothetical protein
MMANLFPADSIGLSLFGPARGLAVKDEIKSHLWAGNKAREVNVNGTVANSSSRTRVRARIRTGGLESCARRCMPG